MALEHAFVRAEACRSVAEARGVCAGYRVARFKGPRRGGGAEVGGTRGSVARGCRRGHQGRRKRRRLTAVVGGAGAGWEATNSVPMAGNKDEEVGRVRQSVPDRFLPRR